MQKRFNNLHQIFSVPPFFVFCPHKKSRWHYGWEDNLTGINEKEWKVVLSQLSISLKPPYSCKGFRGEMNSHTGAIPSPLTFLSSLLKTDLHTPQTWIKKIWNTDITTRRHHNTVRNPLSELRMVAAHCVWADLLFASGSLYKNTQRERHNALLLPQISKESGSYFL